MAAGSARRSRVGVALVALSLALTSGMSVVASADAVTVGISWQARIGTAGANGSATIRAFTTGTGTIVIRLAKVRASTSLPVILSTGTCGSVGNTLIKFPPVRTTSAGTAARTSSLTAAQVAKLSAATPGSARVALRVGSRATGGVKCGVFALSYVPIGIVLPSGFTGSGPELNAALNATGYGARIMYSRDTASEKANVEALIRLGIKVLIIAPWDSAAAALVANEALAAGVKVIAYDRLILNTRAVRYYVTFDLMAVGAAQAHYLIAHAGATKGNNLYLYAGAPSDSNSFSFLEGAWETLQPRIADGTFVIRNSAVAVALQANSSLTHAQQAAIIAQVTTNWDPNTARTMAVSNLAALSATAKGTVFILGPNDATARAIADVFAADKDVTTFYVTGQDAEKASIQYIIDGKQGMTVFKDPHMLVDAALAAAGAFLTGAAPVATTKQNNGAIDVPSLLLPVVPVTKDNVQTALIDTGNQWDRLNPTPTSSDLPEHERLKCVGIDTWVCWYDKLREPSLDFGWNRTSGVFVGATMAGWTCPAWVGALCGHVVRVIAGATTYFPASGSPFTWREDFIVTDGNGVAPFYMSVINAPPPAPAVCPWYRTFDDALASNPTYHQDCFFAP